MTDPARRDLLCRPVEHVDIRAFDARPVIDQFRPTAIQARNLARAADICSEMLADRECTVILTLAGSLVSAGLKKALVTLIDSGMVDVVVSTGANMVDQDFFEALGFRHYMAPGSPEHPVVPDERLRELAIDRIYDTYIDERELRVCDRTMRGIFDRLSARPHSSREILTEMGRFLDVSFPESESVVLSAYRKGVPIFVPALSDCSAGFGIVLHQAAAAREGREPVSLDSGRDFLELARIKLASRATGLLMLGGGVPKNFAQDIVVAAEMLQEDDAGSGGRRLQRMGRGRRRPRRCRCTDTPCSSRWRTVATEPCPGPPCARPRAGERWRARANRWCSVKPRWAFRCSRATPGIAGPGKAGPNAGSRIGSRSTRAPGARMTGTVGGTSRANPSQSPPRPSATARRR